MRQLLADGLREQVRRTALTKDRSALEHHLRNSIGRLRQERMVAFFADADGRLLSEEVLGEGPENGVLLSARSLFGRAMNLDARIVVLAHNHPSGSAEPSAEDIRTTRTLAKLAGQLGITLLDHFIVTDAAVTSCADRGHL
ncbi:JAB domain-containing protein [Qipengyuania sp. 6B39]|uniref:JAB domain-containing protein n=1 Tax=Qipengyuania proteolytica TaxID=2867239 RepID=UPI001C8A791A|nr:JAB domain-containing protein [Qipengyuania proteolytica]MBX7497002.1 JAB domain-containing protein [Qipengyuania proteolytica]